MRRFCAILIGLVFFLAGLFKLIDPVGAALVVRSYLDFFHLGFLGGISGFLAFALAALEAATGLALLGGALRRITAKVATVLIGFFTVITFILMVAHPKMDCGCFGEAVHLSHTQTFIKNVILCALAAGAFIPLPRTAASKKITKQLCVATFLLGIYSLFFLPLWDFTAFSTGNRLYDPHHPFPPVKVTEPGFIYEKDGVRKEFSLEALPDSTWAFVRTADVPEIETPSNFVPVASPDGAVCDSVLLHGRVMAVSVYKPDKLSDGTWADIGEWLSKAEAAGLRPIVLTTEASDKLENVYLSDHKVLMTLNRSNGGATLIDEGLVVGKWSVYAWPSEKKLQKLASEGPGNLLVGTSVPGRMVLCIFMLVAVLLSLYTYRKRIF